MIIISNYRKEKDSKGRTRIISKENSVCPICVGLLKVIGSRERFFIDASGIRKTLIIRRLRCLECQKIHHELPDIVMPYKRHCAETIENAISGDTDYICCDFATEYRIKSWWADVLKYLKGVLVSIRMKHGVVIPPDSSPREIVRAVVNTNNWVHTRTAMTPA